VWILILDFATNAFTLVGLWISNPANFTTMSFLYALFLMFKSLVLEKLLRTMQTVLKKVYDETGGIDKKKETEE
jgi:hypothetical protein